MDAFAIAQLISGSAPPPANIRYGTVTARNTDGTLSIVPDGQTTSVKVVRCCWPPVGGRCLILINGTEWLAIAAIGEEDAPVHVSDIWITKSSDVPSTRWPGTTWEKIENRMILGSGTRAVDATGGSDTHTLTITEMPNHNHIWNQNYNYTTGGNPIAQAPVLAGINAAANLQTQYTGGGAAHNNLPPYRVFHQWLRLS